jgi:hypothetical protein
MWLSNLKSFCNDEDKYSLWSWQGCYIRRKAVSLIGKYSLWSWQGCYIRSKAVSLIGKYSLWSWQGCYISVSLSVATHLPISDTALLLVCHWCDYPI